MKEPSISLCKEGYAHIGLMAFTALIFTVMGCWVMGTVFLVLTWLTVNFFRDPTRVHPYDTDLAVCPADGKVVTIDTHPDPISGEERTRVCIFMNVFNVHVNRTPVAGTVREIRYHPGAFFNASLDKASEKNERNTLAIRDHEGKDWTMVQIAGLIARRIVCWAQTNDQLDRAQRVGIIKFGSRVDLYLPAGYEPCVNLGQHVLAGQTAIARRSGTACGSADTQDA